MSRLVHVLGFRVPLVRDGMSSGLIQAVNRALTLVLSIVLARGLGTESYGIYAYSFAIMGLVMLLSEVGVPNLLVREVAASHGRREWGLLRGVFLRSRQLVMAASLTVSGIALTVLLLRRPVLSEEEFYTLLVMFGMLPAASLGKVTVAGLRGLHRVLLGQTVDLILRPVLVLGLISLFFVFWPDRRDAYYAMGAQFIAAIAVLVTALLLVRMHLPKEVRGVAAQARDREWIRSALTFTLASGALVINSRVDAIMLGWFREPSDVGIYRVAAQSAIFAVFAMQAASAVLGPRFSNLYGRDDIETLKRIFRVSSVIVGAFSFVVFLLFLLLGRQILDVLFGAEYLAAAAPLAVLAGGYSVNALCGPVGLLLQMTGHEALTARVLWGTAILNIALNAGLIPFYGPTGAAAATACSVALYHLILRVRAWKILGI